MTQTGVVAGGALTDWVSLGVLASRVPRDVVDDAVAATGRGARRAGGKLPPHVMVYFVMALALFADDDYEEVAARLAETLRGWGCWEPGWEVPSAGGKGSGEQSLARVLFPQLEEDWLVIAGRNFYAWKDWRTAAGTGAALLWRVRADPRLPVLEMLPDGSCRSVLIDPGATVKQREALAAAARRGQDLEEDRARYVRVIEYDVPDREGDGKGELIVLVTTITDFRAAPAGDLARAYHERWEHETGNAQLKTYLRGPGKVLRSGSPAMVGQEIWGYLLAHCALSALICDAATAAGIDPDRVKFKRTVRVVRRAVGPAFPLTAPGAPWPHHGRHH